MFRALTVVVVGVLATVASVRLFISSDAQSVTPPAAELTGGTELMPFPEDSDYAEPAPAAITISLTLDRTASVAGYLRDAGIERDEALRWSTIFQRAADTRVFYRDHPLTLYKDSETGELRGFRYNLDLKTSVSVSNLGNMVLKASAQSIEYYVKPIQLSFEIRDSFKRAAAKHGIPDPIVESLQDAFSDRLHALDQLKPGSAVKLIYQEKVSRDGSYHLVGDVEAAQITFGSRTLSAFAFRDEHGRAHLYDEHGRALGPQFLRFPLNFKYVSSGFTFHRYHPLLHTYRPHVGVDLVAEYGTPVKAVADGRVEEAGWAGELGNAVRIEHDHGMTSVYGHLSRISPDARPKGWVRMGQIIGWVGSTGLSTGPHLHFALEKQGNYVDPMTQTLGVNHQVSPRMKALFDDLRQRYQIALAKLPSFGSHFVASQRGLDSSKIAAEYLTAETAEATVPRHRSRRSSNHKSTGIVPSANGVAAANGAM